ncbi:MAG: hypothetical protein LLF94_05200 [Chlamydiales bacterium]|nr:hypothetical protein [Chlamydiales bacterium]
MNCDRVVFGADAGFIFSMSQEGRKKAAVPGSYEARVVTALTGRSFPHNPTLIHALPQEHLDSNLGFIQRAKKKFSLEPLRMLDLPAFPGDLLVQSLSIHNKALAVLLDGVCYVIENPGSQKHTVKELFATKDMQLTCIEWINKETLALGIRGHEHLYLVNTLKPGHFRYFGFLPDERRACITRICRISDATFFTGYKSGALLHNDITSGKVTRLLEGSNDAILSISASPERTRVAVGFNSGITKIYVFTVLNNVPDLRVTATLVGGRAFSWQPGSNSNCITGSAQDRTIRYYQLPSTTPTHTLRVQYAVSSLVFLEKNMFVAGCESVLAQFCITQQNISLVNDEKMKTDGSLIDVVYDQAVGLMTASSDEILRVYAPVVLTAKEPDPKKAKSSQVISWITKIR